MRTRISKIGNSTSNNVTELQISIDPAAIHQNVNVKDSNNSVNSILNEQLFINNQINDNDDFLLENEIKLWKKRRSIDKEYVPDEESSIDDEDIKEEDEDLEEYQPLKKRKLSTRKKVVKTSNSSSKEKPVNDGHVSRLHSILYKLYCHENIVKNLNKLLLKMNICLTNKIYSLITNDLNESEVSPALLLEKVRIYQMEKNSSENDTFLSAYSEMNEQYSSMMNEKESMEKNIDKDVDDKIVEQFIKKLIKSKSKFSMLDLIGENDKYLVQTMNSAKLKKSDKLSKRLSSASPKKIKPSKTSCLATVCKGKRYNRLKSENDNEKNCYSACPWPNCTYESKREWALNEHINLTHTGLKQFRCKVQDCAAMFFSSSELDNHIKKHHTDVASKEFMSCVWPGCNALFKSKLGLRAHVQVHKGENLISCDWPGCNYLAKNKRQHENHTRKHTGDRPFSCDFPGCNSKFRTNDSLRHHKKSHSEYRPFKCYWPGCEANFKTNRGLTIHRALHTGEKLFKCDWPECDYASERKYHVDLHIYEKHTHIKPYQCSWSDCDASFLRNDKLQNHLKIHRQEKPFKCIHPSCDKHFVEKGNMMKHYNNVHKRKFTIWFGKKLVPFLFEI